MLAAAAMPAMMLQAPAASAEGAAPMSAELLELGAELEQESESSLY